MVNSISRQEIVEAVEKARNYFVPSLAPKTIGYYKGVWDKLIAYGDESPDKSNVDVRAFYRMVTQAEAYTRPDTRWRRTQALPALPILHRKILNCPELGLAFPYDVDTLLLGYRHIKNQRLESYYTAEEIKAVMDAVDRNTPWGKIISLYQIKTKRYVELPLTDGTALALLDYIKNVRPESDDPHVFLRHTRPYIPYSSKDNFDSKVSYYFKKSGVDTNGKYHGMHSMKHSLATNLLGEDTSVNEIASILGHSSIKLTKPYIWSDIKHLKMCALEVGSHGSR